MFSFVGGRDAALAPGDPREKEAYAHYQEGVRLGYLKSNPMDEKNPMDLFNTSPEDEQRIADKLNARSNSNRFKVMPDGSVQDTSTDYHPPVPFPKTNNSGNDTQGLLNQYYQARQRSEDVISKATAGLSGSFYQAPTSFYQG